MTKEDLLRLIDLKLDQDMREKHSGKATITVCLSQGAIQKAEYQPCQQLLMPEILEMENVVRIRK